MKYVVAGVLALVAVTSLSGHVEHFERDEPPVYVISLGRRHDRRENMLLRVPRARVVEAVDGTQLQHNGGSLTRGEFACFMSHVKTWALVASERADFAIVLEDDADLRFPEQASDVYRLVDACPADWDVLFLGLNNPSQRSAKVGRGIRVMDHDAYGSHAIVLRRSGARKLLISYSALGMKDGDEGSACPVDIWMSRRGLKAYRADPVLVNVTNLRDSDTQRVR